MCCSNNEIGFKLGETITQQLMFQLCCFVLKFGPPVVGERTLIRIGLGVVRREQFAYINSASVKWGYTVLDATNSNGEK